MKTLISVNPSTNEIIGKVTCSSKKEIDKIVNLAQKTKLKWREIGVKKRIKFLENLYSIFVSNKRELMDLTTLEMGMPISSREMLDFQGGLDYFRWYLDNVEKYLEPEISYQDKKSKNTVYYEPLGVSAVIVPWNFPFCNFVWGVIPNLLVGNTVIFKHSEEVPLFAKKLDEVIKKTKLPDGVFNQIFGNGVEGDYLVHQNINLIWFTGSTKVGQKLNIIGAEKFAKVLLELGGSAPGIVFDDANLSQTIETIYNNRFSNSGQQCDGLKRLIVQEGIYPKLLIQLQNLLETKIVGDPTDPKTDIGPLVAKRQLDAIKIQIDDAVKRGAKIITCGQKKYSNGAFCQPTLITNIKQNMKVWQEEVFAPVLPIITFKTEDEAIALANDTEYGLGSYIFSKDKNRAQRVANKIQAGMVAINNSIYLNPSSPFGGYKKSGVGREHGKYGFHELCQIKVLSEEL